MLKKVGLIGGGYIGGVLAQEIAQRGLAREIGMSPTGLRDFLEGADPYLKTERKLRAWFTRRKRRGAPETVTPEVAQAALAVLLEHLPERTRPTAADGLLEFLHGASEASEVPVPRWIATLRGGGPGGENG